MAKIVLFATNETTHCDLWYSLNSQRGPLGIDAGMAGRVVVRFSSPTFDSPGAQKDSIGPSQSFTCDPKVLKETLVSGSCTFGP